MTSTEQLPSRLRRQVQILGECSNKLPRSGLRRPEERSYITFSYAIVSPAFKGKPPSHGAFEPTMAKA